VFDLSGRPKSSRQHEGRGVAEDWYLGLKGKHRARELKNGKTFKFAAAEFRKEYEGSLGQASGSLAVVLRR
jgi:hypothetical protein